MDDHGFGMKWHKFLIYFSMWANAISCILLGLMGLSVLLGIFTPGRYRHNEGLVIAVGLIGIALIVVGIYCVITRFKLANRKSGAVYHLTAVWILSGVLSALFMMIDEGISMSSCISTFIMAAVNFNYYKKREELFIN